ncbi:three-Cys-motif partner protein TcmP [Marinitoga sp. 1138]|uniref:three-Cys-motif partner protein TcmP n=1 Tax=Marinitoga sp. 1138 TaxID=1643334 RepID=UPI001585D57A|nr:three-Cys-motif partner protein TcmP [Marinitoga sp. 1138]NUU96719.1 hypothetical protein [Marinitoga sp. 1138]
MAPKSALDWDIKEHTLIKEAILGKYLHIWFTALSKNYPSIFYIDGFAGSGILQDTSGNIKEGSPLIALEETFFAFEKHNNTNFYLFFIEKNKESSNILQNTLEQKFNSLKEKYNFEEMNEKIKFKVRNIEFDSLVKSLKVFLEQLPQNELKNLPLFVFIDPFGLNIKFEWIEFFLKNFKSEIFINFISSGIIRNKKKLSSEKIKEIFGEYIDLNQINDYALEFKNQIKKKFPDSKVLIFPIKNSKNSTVYKLIHISKHHKAVEKMKEIMFNESIFSNSFGFSVNKQSYKEQFFLFDIGEEVFENAIKEKYPLNEKIIVENIYNSFTRSDEFIWPKKKIREYLLSLEKKGKIRYIKDLDEKKKRRKNTLPDSSIIEIIK